MWALDLRFLSSACNPGPGSPYLLWLRLKIPNQVPFPPDPHSSKPQIVTDLYTAPRGVGIQGS